MIFCIVGNAHQPFNRLINFSIHVSKLLNEELMVQNNLHMYRQINVSQQVGSLSHQDFISAISQSSLVICHAGAGTLRSLNSLQKKSICIPRMKVFGEHVNDHQVQIANEFNARGLSFLPTDYSSSAISPDKALNNFQNFDFNFSNLSDIDLSDTIVSIVDEILRY